MQQKVFLLYVMGGAGREFVGLYYTQHLGKGGKYTSYIRWWLHKVMAMRDSQQNISRHGSRFELDFNVS